MKNTKKLPQNGNIPPKGARAASSTGRARAFMTGVNAQAGFAAGHNDCGSATAARAQLSDCAPLNAVGLLNEECKLKQKRSGPRRKIFKIVAASGLAIMMGAGVIFGVGATASSSSAQLGDRAQAQQQEKALHDAGIWSGGDLGLDPENDPVVWVTDNGFEIKSHDVSVSGGTTTVSTVAYKYVTLGSYNWIIIGYSTNNATQGTGNVGVSTSNNYDRNTYTTWLDTVDPKLIPDSTDAGNAIKNAIHSKSTNFYNTSSFTYKLKTIFTNAVGAGEIPAGCVLCLCAGTTGTSEYDNWQDTPPQEAKFPGSTLDKAMETVYSSIKSAANNQIVESELITAWYNGSTKTTYEHKEHLFPLACSTSWSGYTQTYCVETYLNTDAKRSIHPNAWHLRTGGTNSTGGLCVVYAWGDIDPGTASSSSIGSSYGVRPAFVLKLY